VSILSIEEAKAKGLVNLVAQLERDLERRQLLKMKPLEEVKVEMEINDMKEDLEALDDFLD
jgi:hypothetical protein